MTRAHASNGVLYAALEIRTDPNGGYAYYRWQSAGPETLWRGEDVVAQGAGAFFALSQVLQNAHADSHLDYHQFAIYVYGWIAGVDRLKRKVGATLAEFD